MDFAAVSFLLLSWSPLSIRRFDCFKGHVIEVVESFYVCQACVIERCRVEQALAHPGEACAVEIRPFPFRVLDRFSAGRVESRKASPRDWRAGVA